jgi:hypothetical protein
MRNRPFYISSFLAVFVALTLSVPLHGQDPRLLQVDLA